MNGNKDLLGGCGWGTWAGMEVRGGERVKSGCFGAYKGQLMDKGEVN